jgi:rod shape-determining protein MreC
MKNRPFFDFKKIISLFLIFLFFLLINFFWKEEIKNFFFKIVSPFQSFFWKNLNFLSFLPQKISQIKNLYSENQNLKKQNLELLAEIERLKEEKKECEFLKKDFDKNFSFELELAKVVGKLPDKDSLLINKGQKDGVFVGETVLSEGKILLGKIEKVYPNFSVVKLISSKDFKVLVRKENLEKDLLLEGKGNLNLMLNFVPKEIELNEKEKIFTSPSQTYFPPHILIGEIEKIEKKETLPYFRAKIKPYFFNLEFVYLVKNFTPWEKE